MKKIILGFFVLFILAASFLCFSSNSFATSVSFDQLAASSDLTTTKYNRDLDTIYSKVNSGIQTDNITDDTITEPDFADDSNPRIRTYEGASCEFVYTGLLPTTTVGTLVGSVPSGTAYPLGYRVRKASSTPKTFTASKWTYVDLDINGNFTYPEVAINAAAPSVTSNSIRLARVSTDGTQVAAVQDLRTTSCNQGPFANLKDESTGASLADMTQFGRMRISQDNGWVYGAQVSWDTHSTFKVLPGSAYFSQSGDYRAKNSTITVSTSADDPTNGISGIDTPSIGANTRYYVYLVADQSGVADYSVSFSTSGNAPSGITNYRKIGMIRTDASSLFTSPDILTTANHGKVVRAWHVRDGNMATGTGTYTHGTGAPTCSDGTQFMQVSLDPISPSNYIRGVATVNYANDTSAVTKQLVEVCKGSTVVGAVVSGRDSGEDNILLTAQVPFRFKADTTDRTTLTVRSGGNGASTTTFNGESGAAIGGGKLSSEIYVEETEDF